MLVLTFAAHGKHNCVTIGGKPYIYADTRRGAFVTSARCAHRGGPLHLAAFEDGPPRLICPWHERSTSVGRRLTAGIPVVRRGNVVTAVFPHPAGTPYEIGHLPVAGELAIGAPGRSRSVRECRSVIPTALP